MRRNKSQNAPTRRWQAVYHQLQPAQLRSSPWKKRPKLFCPCATGQQQPSTEVGKRNREAMMMGEVNAWEWGRADDEWDQRLRVSVEKAGQKLHIPPSERWKKRPKPCGPDGYFPKQDASPSTVLSEAGLFSDHSTFWSRTLFRAQYFLKQGVFPKRSSTTSRALKAASPAP